MTNLMGKHFKAIIICMISVVFLLGLFLIPNIFKAKQGTALALEVFTGFSAGDQVGGFIIEYKDTSGENRAEYIFPNDGDYYASQQYAIEHMPEEAVSDYEEQKKAMKSLGYTCADWSNAKDTKPLQPYSQNTYFVELGYELESIERIQVLWDPNMGTTDNWDCQDILVYLVEEIKGVHMYGQASVQIYYDYVGELVAKYIPETAKFYGSKSTIFTLDAGDELQVSGFGANAYKEVDDSEYIVKLDFADAYGAGVEAFGNVKNKLSFDKMSLPEMLTIRMDYVDVFGVKRMVYVPVITSAYNYAKANLPESTVVGFAGQGESIVFSVRLPDMAEVSNVSFYYGFDYSMNEAGFFVNKSQNESKGVDFKLFEQRVEWAKEDTISISGLSIYKQDKSESIVRFEVENDTIIRPILREGLNPLFYYCSTNYTGLQIVQNTSVSTNLSRYKEGALLSPVNNQQRFLLVIDTFDVPTNGIVDERPILDVSLSYVAVNGVSRQTDFISLEALSKDYYGFAPDYTMKDCGYAMNISTGQKLYAVLSLNDVAKFTDISFKLNNNTEWQISNFAIYYLDDMSSRKAKWLDAPSEAFGQKCDFTYYREINNGTGLDRENMMYSAPFSFLLTMNSIKSISFTSKEVTEISTVVNWMSQNKYSLPYDMTMSNLGFYNTKITYIVDVKVASNANNDLTDGDSGSKNLFYFQLVFKNGKSAIVLANQQLASDGFISGQISTFRIAVNQDYGELQSVRIIADDLSSESDPYDKLNIDSITVSRAYGTGNSSVWLIDDVGWLGIDYMEDEEKENREENSRTMDEIAQDFYVTGVTSMVDLQFAMTFVDILSPEGFSSQQFQGSVSATIGYIDSNGSYCTFEISDLVGYMYDYIEKTPSNLASNQKYLSNTDFMFKHNSTNFFTVRINDLKQLKNITLNVYAERASLFNLSSVSASLITKDGTLALNKWGEYEKTSEVTQLTANRGYIVPIHLNEKQNATFTIEFSDMDPNMLTGLLDGSWPYSIPENTISTYDYLNVYVYPGSGSIPENVSNSGMKLLVEFKNAYNKAYVSTAPAEIHMDENGNYYYFIPKLGTSGLEAIKRIQAISTGTASVPLGEVVVQRVRQDVVVSTHYYNFENADLLSSPDAKLQTSVIEESSGKQKVELYMLDQMPETVIVADGKDIAVALRYTLKNDPTGVEYISSFVYASATGLTSLKAGQCVEIPFNIANLNEITGVTVAALGGLSVNIDNISAVTYQNNTATETEAERYSITYAGVVENESKHFVVETERLDSTFTLVPIEITLQTASDASMITSTDTPIRMEMKYEGFDGVIYTKVFEDITTYKVSGGFTSEVPAVLRMSVPNVRKIISLSFEPYDVDNTNIATWKLASVKLKYGHTINNTNKEYPIPVNKLAKENEPIEVICKNILLEVWYIQNDSKIKYDSTQKGIVITEGEQLKFMASLVNSTLDVDVKVYEMIENGLREIGEDYVTQHADGSLIFCIPKASSSGTRTFSIEISAKENPEVKLNMTVIVIEEDVETESEPETDSDSENGTEGEGGTESGNDSDTESETEAASEVTIE